MTIGYLLDTSVASIAWDAGNPRHALVQQRLRALARAPVLVSVVTLGEVEYGLALRPNLDEGRTAAIRAAMASYSQVLDVDRHVARVYGQLRAELFNRFAPKEWRGRMRHRRPEELVDRTTSKQLGIQENDLWITSTAVNYNLALVVHDAGMARVHSVARDVFSDYDQELIVWGDSEPPSSEPPPSAGTAAET